MEKDEAIAILNNWLTSTKSNLPALINSNRNSNVTFGNKNDKNITWLDPTITQFYNGHHYLLICDNENTELHLIYINVENLNEENFSRTNIKGEHLRFELTEQFIDLRSQFDFTQYLIKTINFQT